jgi:hypothetical protein
MLYFISIAIDVEKQNSLASEVKLGSAIDEFEVKVIPELANIIIEFVHCQLT